MKYIIVLVLLNACYNPCGTLPLGEEGICTKSITEEDITDLVLVMDEFLIANREVSMTDILVAEGPVTVQTLPLDITHAGETHVNLNIWGTPVGPYYIHIQYGLSRCQRAHVLVHELLHVHHISRNGLTENGSHPEGWFTISTLPPLISYESAMEDILDEEKKCGCPVGSDRDYNN